VSGRLGLSSASVRTRELFVSIEEARLPPLDDVGGHGKVGCSAAFWRRVDSAADDFSHVTTRALTHSFGSRSVGSRLQPPRLTSSRIQSVCSQCARLKTKTKNATPPPKHRNPRIDIRRYNRPNREKTGWDEWKTVRKGGLSRFCGLNDVES